MTTWNRLLKDGRNRLFALVFLCGDYLAVVLAAQIAVWLRGGAFAGNVMLPAFVNIPDIYQWVVFPLVFVVFNHIDGQYSRRAMFWQMSGSVIKTAVYSLLLWLVFFTLTKEIGISRLYMLLFWLIAVAIMLALRYIAKKIMIAGGVWQVPVILVGAGKTGGLIVKGLKRDAGLGYKVVGFIDDSVREKSFYGIKRLGGFADIERIIIHSRVRDVLVAAPGLSSERLVDLVHAIQPLVNNVIFVPDLIGIPVIGLQTDAMFAEKIALLKVRNNLAVVYNRAVKMLFDIVAGFILMIMLLPVLAVIAVIVRLDSPGPAIYKAERLCRNGKKFRCFKFRTMFVDSEHLLHEYLANNPAARAEWEKFRKLKSGDPRLTSVGRWLRRTSLDELPQIFNVYRMEMSLVGPRPYLPSEKKLMGHLVNDVLMVKPGITGFWQVSGRNEISFDERVQMDSWYVRNWSLWLDMVLMVKTMGVVFKRKGAY